jgi:hypothetical protein
VKFVRSPRREKKEGRKVDKLDIFLDSGAVHAGDENTAERVKFYESSVPHRFTGGRLLSLITVKGDGLRMTEAQVEELRDYLDDWLGDAF